MKHLLQEYNIEILFVQEMPPDKEIVDGRAYEKQLKGYDIPNIGSSKMFFSVP